MTDTRKRHRTPITFDPAILKWLEDNHRANGHASVSKFADSIISEYVKSKTAPPEPEGPLTPEQEVEKTVEEIGNLTVTYHEKFEAMRSLVPKDAPKLQTLEDVKKRVDFIWAKVIDKNGFVLGDRGKVVPLSKTDVLCYESLCQLQLKKLELQKVISVAAVAGAQ